MRILALTTSRADWNSLGMVAMALRDRGADVEVTHWDDMPHDAAVRGDGFGTTRLVTKRPHMVVVCGDRMESLVGAVGLVAKGVPIAHLAGGDVSGGSLDERWRHAITKIADVHFPTHEKAAARLLRMGEHPGRVHMLGSASIDRLRVTPLLSAEDTAGELKQPPGYILCNWQAETAGGATGGPSALLVALAEVGTPVVFVGCNPDPGAAEDEAMIVAWAEAHGATFIANMSPRLYLSALAHASVLVGNSSSGFYEAPYYGTPVVNVGKRQDGRGPVPVCMVHVANDANMIAWQVAMAVEAPRPQPEMLFGDGHAAERIAATILSYEGVDLGGKRFHD